MSKYAVIESGIPIPKIFGTGGTAKYGFGELKVGDSFKVKPEDYKVIRSAAAYYAKRHPEYKFIVRRTPAEMRIWRIDRNRED